METYQCGSISPKSNVNVAFTNLNVSNKIKFYLQWLNNYANAALTIIESYRDEPDGNEEEEEERVKKTKLSFINPNWVSYQMNSVASCY